MQRKSQKEAQCTMRNLFPTFKSKSRFCAEGVFRAFHENVRTIKGFGDIVRRSYTFSLKRGVTGDSRPDHQYDAVSSVIIYPDASSSCSFSRLHFES